MTFQNITLLIGIAAIGIPIALHLIARKEPKQVLFPSIRLLSQRVQSNRSKLRIRRWWLLALRIAALLAVVFALARPVIAASLSLAWTTLGILAIAAVGLLAMASVAATKSSPKALTGSLLAAALTLLAAVLIWGGYTFASGETPQIDQSGPVALAVVIDNAPLSAWQDGQQSQLQSMQQAARSLMMAAGSESRYAVIDRSAAPAQFALDLAGALSKADALETLEVVQPLESRIEAAARLLKTSEIASRQLVIVSALPRSSFADPESPRSLAGLFDDPDIRVTWWDVGPFKGVNRSIGLPVLSDQSPAPDTPVTVTATLSLEILEGNVAAEDAGSSADRSDGSTDVTAECVLYPASASLPVVRNGQIVRPEAKPVDRASASLTPNRDVELTLALPPLPQGLHHGAIRLIGEDASAIDDTVYFTVEVLPPSRLLLVGDQVEEREEMARAIAAPASLDDPAAQYNVERVGYTDLAASRLSDFDGVILLEPPASAFDEPELVRYRAAGGSVLAAIGDALGVDEVRLENWPVFERPWRVPPPGTYFQISAASHPALNQLASIPDGVPFADFPVYQYWKVEPNENAQVLMRYAGTGHPALIELDESTNSAIDGRSSRVLVLTTPIPELASPATAWNELFSGEEFWPAFYLLRDLTRYLTGRNAERWTLPVGSTVSVAIAGNASAATDAADDGRRRLQWFPPRTNAPVPIEIPAGKQGETVAKQRVIIGQPKHSGVHWIRGERLGLGFTTNVPRDALSTKPVDSDALDTLFGEGVLQRITSLDQMEWTATDESQVVALWSPMMLLALIAFLLEQVLSNRFYRQTPGPAFRPRSGGVAA